MCCKNELHLSFQSFYFTNHILINGLVIQIVFRLVYNQYVILFLRQKKQY